MKGFFRFLLSCLLPLVAAAQPSPSQHGALPISRTGPASEVREVVERSLLGRWSADPNACDLVTSWSWVNARTLQGVFGHGGRPITRYELQIEDVKLLLRERDRTVWSYEFKSVDVASGIASTLNVVLESFSEGRRRTLQSVKNNTDTLIKDGRFVASQSMTPSVFRCRDQTEVVQASGPAEPPRSTLNLAVTASPPDSNGVLTLNITTRSDTASLRVNGDEVGGRADGRYSVNRFAQIGDNSFEVIATDRFGNTQKQTIAVSRRAADNTVRFASLNPIAVRARPATNSVAIIIGIQDYRRVPKAEFASNDARVFYDYAVRGLGVRPENVKLLVDQEADAIEILSAFNNWLPLKARRGQTDVYVFFSGHGLPSDDGSNLYLLPHGVDRQFLDRTAIKQSELVASLQAVSPRSVTMFMDACYSGQIRTGETLLASARPIAIQAKASSFPPNFSVISASAPDQLASSSPDLKHGIFSYYLMKGMEGEADENRDGNITMAEMQSYLKEFVGKKAMSLSRTQVPQLTGDQSRVLVSR